MTSRRTVFLLTISALVLVGLAVGGTLAIVTIAHQKPIVPSDAPLFRAKGELALAEDNNTWAWSDSAYASASKTDPKAAFICPAGSSNAASFVAALGDERTIASWAMWEFIGAEDDPRVLLAPLTPDRMGSGSGQAIHQSGGQFSLGVACTSNNNLIVTAAFYRTIKVRPGGDWVLEPLK
jgi:hypothetical protein